MPYFWWYTMAIKKLFFSVSFSIFLLSSLLHSGISTVKAQEATPTEEPTPTFESIMNLSGTPVPQNYDCPNLITGYLTKTPSSNWMMYCSDCLREIEMQETPSPTPDPLITPTVTPTPEERYYIDPELVEFKEFYTLANTTGWNAFEDTKYSTNGDQLVRGWMFGYFAHVHTGIASWGIDPIKFNGQSYSMTYGDTFLKIIRYNINLTTEDIENLQQDLNEGGVPPLTLNQNNNVSAGITVNAYDVYTVYTKYYWYQTPGDIVGITFFYAPIYYGNPPETIEPTPIPTQSVNGYCSEIQEESEEQEPLLKLPNFMVGQSVCYQIQGYEVDFGAVNWLPGVNIPTVVVPGFNICLKAIEFGKLDLIGFQIDLDMLAGLAGAIALLRIFLRS